jgi:deoxyribodipyrimidine photo-lyase
MKNNTSASIVWFRQDLRLEDNSALAAAVARGGSVIPVYIWSSEEEGDWAPGKSSRWWLGQSLAGLSHDLGQAGSRLVVRRGRSAAVLHSIIQQTGATALFLNRRYEPAAARRDSELMMSLAARGIDVFAFNDSLLFDPALILNQSGKPYRVFTPFWNRLLTMEDPGMRVPKPASIPAPSVWPSTTDVDGLRLGIKSIPAHLEEFWHPGEWGAFERFRSFLPDGPTNYTELHNTPGVSGTSRLSPHLHFGEISPRRLWYDIRVANGDDPHNNPYLRQLAWREFSYYLLFHYPDCESTPLNPSFESFSWRKDLDGLRAWKQGQTGYPLVDAGMRELTKTGWMHNRVRMVAASFLVKHLMIHWREGARWFWENLVDADLANNTMGWQWTAGCGADAAPYFRIFNPVLQGSRFDANGEYVRQWVPELAGLTDRYIHQPWKAPAKVLDEAGLKIGRGYPAPIVDHAFARNRALAAFASLGDKQPFAKTSNGGR